MNTFDDCLIVGQLFLERNSSLGGVLSGGGSTNLYQTEPKHHTDIYISEKKFQIKGQTLLQQ